MAKTLMWFEGFASGGLEGLEGVTGTPNIQTTNKHSGTYALELAQGEAVEIDDAPTGSSPSGTGVYLGFFARWADVTPGTETEFFRAEDAGARLFSLILETDGDIRVEYNTGTANTISAPSLSINTFHRIEIYFDPVASGDIDIDIDGVNVLNQSGKDLIATGNISWYGFLNDDTALYTVDDFFIYRADSAADFLGADWAGLSPFNPQDPDATAYGSDALDSGNWDDMASIPFADGSFGLYTGTPRDGHDRSGQPTGLNNGQGMSVIVRADRENGGATTQNIRYGKNGGSDSTADKSIDLTVATANYPHIITSDTSFFPQTATDHVLLGFNVSGNRDMTVYDMVAQILHVPSSGTTFEEDIALTRGQNTIVPIIDLIRVGAITLSRGQNTLIPVADITRVGVLTLSRGQNTVTLLGNIDTSQALTLGKELGSAWIGNIITPQALALAIVNRTIVIDAGLLYASTISLARGQNTLVPISTLSRAGLLSLGKDKGVSSTSQLDAVGAVSLGKEKGISFVSQLDAVGALSFGRDLGITIAGNIIAPTSVTLGSKDIGLTLDGNIITPQGLSLGKDKGLSFLSGAGFAAALSLAKDAGITYSTGLTRVGALSLSRDAGIALTNFMTAIGMLSLNTVRVIALNGSLVSSPSLSLAKDLGIVESAQAELNAVLSLAKFVAFVPTIPIVSGVSLPVATGDITLIEDVTGILEIIEQATGNIVLIETPTGTLIIDLTP